MGDQLFHIADGVHRNSGGSSFRRIFRRHVQLLRSGLRRQQRHGQYAVDTAHLSGERNLAEEYPSGWLGREHLHADQNAQQNGEIVHGADLFHVGRCEIDGDAAGRQKHGHGGQCSPNALSALPHGRIGQPHDFELGIAAADADFHVNGKGVQPEQPQTFDLGKHRFTSQKELHL